MVKVTEENEREKERRDEVETVAGGKLPRTGTSNLATQHFHYHWSYPSGGPGGTQATFHFGPGFEPQTSPHQHVVYFHVNPGVTVSFQMGDTSQTIKGPMTVPMVSTNSSPPIAMPVQVPHGHVVQQIVDESGTLRHVILSPQHPPLLPLPQHFGGGNPSGSSQPASYYPGAMAHGFPAFSPLQPGGVLGHVPPQGHSPPPHNYHKDERTQRQYNKLKKKLEQKQHREHQLNTTPPLSPRKEMNGTSRKGVGSVGTSEDGEESSSLQDDEEENSVITDLLGTIKAPEVSDVTSRTALVQWSPPQIDNPRDVSYDVLLSDRGKEGKYKSIYSGEALSCRIEDLKPGTEYSVRVSARLESIVGCPSEPTLLVTPPCKPDPPPTPKLSSRSRNAITLKWLAAQDNGGHIDHYVVEWEQNGVWTEISKYKSKQAHIPKLQPATQYCFRIAAINQFGKSDYSGVGKFVTCDSPPPQPLPPTLTAATPQSLTLAWAVRQQDDEFMLQMEDIENKHGFLPVYSGKDNSYVCLNLRKNTTYKFRLKSQNDDGCSRWSDEVSYSTKPGRPGPPSRPQLKGKLHLHFFRLKWDPPVDTGGAPITNYTVQIHKYNKDTEYQVVYNGPNLTCTIEKLEPGTAYQVRVCCEGPGGTSDFSEPALLATEPVCPGACSSPRLHGRVRSHSIPIKWSYPENDGGSPITEMEVGVRTAEETELRTAYKGKETECVVNELRPAQLYTIVVRAANKVGAGRWSEPLEVMSGCAAPGTPPPPTLGLGAGSVTCSWSPPPAHGSPITSYTLQMATPPGDNYTQVYAGPATHCEVKPVPPATLCLFRLQASNSIGLSDWSEVRTIVTSAGPPGAVPGLKAESVSPTSISLAWGSPQPNGDLVTHYTVEAGDFSTTVTEQTCLLNALTPATTYRIRVRGVNSIGSGAVSTLKVSTLPLPPEPPQLTCATAGHNFLKLRWGQPNSNVNNHVYTVSMSTHSNRRMVVYEGTSTSCKVSRLQEQSSYNFNITASNSTGKGPESETYTFSTVIAPPPLVKGLKVTEVSNRGCHVEWTALRPQGNDQVDYTIQCARLREQTYKQVYHGSETKCEISELEAGADYLVRACAVRLSPKGPIEGQYCPPVNFSTPPVHHEPPQHPVVRQHTHQGNGRRPLTDQQWAGIILSGFIVLAVLFAMLIAHIIY